MARIRDIVKDKIDGYTKKLFDAQTKNWGNPLLPYLIYARRPSILKSVQGMWAGLATSGLLDSQLTTLVNRRVASINGCVF